MKKRVLALAMVVAMAAMSLVACGNKGGNDNKANANAKYKVGVIQLVQHPALDAATEGFEAALKEKLGDDVDVEVQNAAGEAATCATIANQYVSSGKDLIMGNATAALQAAVQATDSIPVLGTSITDYATALDMDDWTGVTGKNVSGTTDLAPLADQAAMIKELYPDAKTVGILYCSAEPNSLYQAKVITEELDKLGIKATEYSFADSNDVASVAQSAASSVDVIYIPTDNTAASCTEAIANVVVPAKVPVIAGEEGICSGCGVATLSIDYYELGYQTGLMAAEILANGADITTMEVKSAPNVTKKYNADICEKLGVTIPDDYEAIVVEE